jgi:ABC-2 type transport system ATP-binding protein
MDRGKVLASGTPGSLKGNGGENMRFELVLEPRAELPGMPGFLRRPVTTGRRVIARLGESDIPTAVQWASTLKETGVVEEYSVGPITLDDVYLNLVGHTTGRDDALKEADHETAAP